MDLLLTDHQVTPLESGGGPDRFPALQAGYGRLPEHVRRAGDAERQADTLAELLGLCWPNAGWLS